MQEQDSHLLQHSNNHQPIPQSQLNQEQSEVPITQLQVQDIPEAERFIAEDLPQSNSLKTQAKLLFGQGEIVKAIQKYQQALQFLPENQSKAKSVLYSNIAICLIRQQDHQDAIAYCKKALKHDPLLVKALTNLALSHEKTDKFQQALQNFKSLHQINPNDQFVSKKMKELEGKVAILNEKRKDEVLSGLKTIGNNILGYFGMSLDNFKLEQGNGGGYNVSYKN